MATDTPIRIHGRLLRVALVLAGLAALCAARPAAASYGWPLKPFDRQHPVRGFFGDPRIGVGHDGMPSHQLHFGIDIAAPDGTPVYATLSGRISIDPQHGDVVHIVSGVTDFSYWHIVPAVRSGQALAYRTLIGYVEAGWEHVHFSEAVAGVYVNPLRLGALAPYRDDTQPIVHALGFEREGSGIGRTNLEGTFDLVVQAYDETPMRVPGRWADKPVMVALVEWRIVGNGHRSAWKTAVDSRDRLPSCRFDDVFAKWTRQNRPSWRGGQGRYRVYLAEGWRSDALPNGSYRLEVRVSDTRGNTARASVSFSLLHR
jgi:peptidase M23-like protein